MADDRDVSELVHSLVRQLKREGYIQSWRVEAAFRAVPRHPFLPGLPLERVYSDEAIPTKFVEGQAVSSSSQPAIMAIMLEQLGLEPGHRVLEIGAGTGYNAALLAHLVGAAGQVVTVDIDADIVEAARAHLQAAGVERVRVVCADGGYGYPALAPYDRIILTVGAGDITPAWREQLKSGGRLVLPLSFNGPQKSVALEKMSGALVSLSVRDCGFMTLRGAFAEQEQSVQLGPEPGLRLTLNHPDRVEADAVYGLLTGPSRDRPTGVRVLPREAWGGALQWLALREPELCELCAEEDWAERNLVPRLLEISGAWRMTLTRGLVGPQGLSLLTRPPNQPGAPEDVSFELFVRTYGPDEALAERLVAHLKAWEAAGRPSTQGLRLKVFPVDATYRPAPNEIVLERRWSKMVLEWK
jgi:protein-L-isoaspartate(D-aspartate) O-methyltransferase